MRRLLPLLRTCALLALGAVPAFAAQPDRPKEPPETPKPKKGLILNDPRAYQGYTLLATNDSTNTYLVDMEGRVVRFWKSEFRAGHAAYILENGHLLRAGAVPNPSMFGGGSGGRVQEFTWEGELVWDYNCANETMLQHHDICKLPNGNVLINLWEKKTPADALAAGRRPETVGQGFLMSGGILEVQPTGKTTGKVVWEWHAWDHLVQEFDANKPNHGDVGAHAELIDLNFGSNTIAAMIAKPEELAKLRAIGYVGGAGRKGQPPSNDWLHVNAVTYNAELDQIMLSVHEFNEVWILDHGTTTAEAAGHVGGRQGKGGDLLYRWGNPAAYRAGATKDQQLFGQHNAQWIPRGIPGAGHILVFNNGMRRPGGAYSTVDEFVPPVNSKGEYEYTKGKAFGPEKAIWSYAAPKKTDFFAGFISGAQRQPNGDTLICSGTNGTIFEVTPEGETVWKYVNPTKGNGPMFGPPGGRPGGQFGGPPRLGELVSPFLVNILGLSAEQKKELETREKEFGEKLDKLLTEEQKKGFKEKPRTFGPGSMPSPGELLARGDRESMKLTPEQAKQLEELQKEADGALAKLFKDDQKKRFKEMQDFGKGFAGGPGGGPPGGGPPGGGRPGGPPGGGPPGGFPGFGGPGGGSAIFRAPRYAPDYPGLAGKELKGTKTIEQLEAAAPKEPAKK